jgi:D-glycero-D-manno-heptose 1,7-bisphosphate phosphatase
MSDFKLIIFDVDNTLVEPASGETFRKSADDWKWMPGRLEKLAELDRSGVKMAIASNQGGVAFGLLDPLEIRHELRRTAEEGHIPYVAMCFSHPKAKLAEYREDSPRRKPGPGMLLEIMEASGESAEDTLMVGDRPEDEGAAKSAGVDFMWANQFFGDEE